MTTHQPTPADLLALRASLNMTQGEVAEALGISLSAYHRRERGLVAITREMVLAMERLRERQGATP